MILQLYPLTCSITVTHDHHGNDMSVICPATHAAALITTKSAFTQALIPLKLKQMRGSNKQQNDPSEISALALTDSVSQLIKHQMFLQHKQTTHQGDPNSWSPSASPLTDTGAPRSPYS